MQLGDTSEFSWIINIAFFAFIMLFSLYGAKFQMWQYLKQIESGLLELKRMWVEARQKSIEAFKEYGRSEEEIAKDLDRWMDYFTIMPVDLDPAGILKRLDHLLDERRDRFEEFIADLAPESQSGVDQNLENTLEVTQVLSQVYRVVRHYYLLGKKTGSQLMIMQVHMQLPDLLMLAKAYFDALEAFAAGKPIGDSIGPLVVTRFAREYGATAESYTHEIAREVGYYTVEVEGRTVYALRATGPGGTVGKPGLAVKNLVEKYPDGISRIITVDAALKLEGEDLGRVAEGTGAAIGDPGPEKHAIEVTAQEHGLGIEAIVVKENEEVAVGIMDKKILDAVPEVISRIKEALMKRTKPGDGVILAGIGNTIGIGL
ncbi:MAG: DUF1512 family protein [Candidatus Thorarchaeota archaeon]|nr:MAG: DUF1512 domain-containing protein [Candidatus Thorarchaeota archaeon]RLI60159.1 MAG: DUF1512 domain-containing protein [Candidatus Thorarchaeota archaeon]